uniref:Craniofacial development protein 2-like n=1 Tax=Nelumbo nucifera TaxID=4432 RepID=A0A822ZID2_NELNU|nr:TPA_asm: hypothetical protein HUJ06_002540 [Nelumbo nucifera]
MCQIGNSSQREPWFLSLIYGHPMNSKRKELWPSLMDLEYLQDAKWVLCGDLNDTLCHHGYDGSRTHGHRPSQNLRKLVDKFNLVELDSRGLYYTWSNKQHGKGKVNGEREAR